MNKRRLASILQAASACVLLSACGLRELPTPAKPPDVPLTQTAATAHASTITPRTNPVQTQAPPGYCSDSNPEPGLFRLAAARHITIGAYATLERIKSDRKYCETMLHDFNLDHVENFSHPAFWGSRPGEYHFDYANPIVEYANGQGWRVRGSHLVWGWKPFLPDWLLNGKFTKAEYESILETHIKTVVGHYRGKVQEWSIANEVADRDPSVYPYLQPGTAETDFWMDTIGPQYIEKAFRWARETDPAATLILNGNTLGLKRMHPGAEKALELTEQIVKRLNAGSEKLVDAVGLQMHIFDEETYLYPTQQDLRDTMNRLAKLGVKVYITELDVDIQHARGSDAMRLAFQAKLYQDVLAACLGTGACAGFDTMNVDDSESLIILGSPYGVVPHPDGDPLMFDLALRPKPAYFAVRDVLSGAADRGTNLALHRPAQASSNEPNAALTPSLAVDGDNLTRWGSGFSASQWIRIDLGAVCDIRRVVLDWETAHGVAYEIQISDDGADWETIYSTTTGDGIIDDLAVSGRGRYIRMLGTARNTDYGYSLWEFEVYGDRA